MSYAVSESLFDRLFAPSFAFQTLCARFFVQLLFSLIMLSVTSGASANTKNYAPIKQFWGPDTYKAYRGYSFGDVFSTRGDIDGDGKRDVIVSGKDDLDYSTSAVYVYGISSKDYILKIPLRNYKYIWALDAGGDLNGDGRDDILVGQLTGTDSNSYTFTIKAFSGADGSLLHQWTAEGGSDARLDARIVGDVNNNGLPDVAIIAGRSRSLYSGRDGSLLRTIPTGRSVGDLGDINGDGHDDLLIRNDRSVAIISGKDASYIRHHSYSGNSANRVTAGVLGDINQDNITDYIVHENRATGQLIVFSGATGAILRESSVQGEIQVLGDIDGDGTNDFFSSKAGIMSGRSGVLLHKTYDTVFGALSTFSKHLVDVGDVNGNGTDDVVVWDEKQEEILNSLYPRNMLSVHDVRFKDSDRDRIPDHKESQAGMDPNNNQDARLDTDNDGRSNRAEITTGHNPNNSNDYPGLTYDSWRLATDLELLIDRYFTAVPDNTGELQELLVPRKKEGHRVRLVAQPQGRGSVCLVADTDTIFTRFTRKPPRYNNMFEFGIACGRRNLEMEKLSSSSYSPSVVNAVVKVTDESTNIPVFGLSSNDFKVLEDNAAASAESFLSAVPLEDAPYTLKTVVMLDISSSLSAADIIRAKQALISLVVDSAGKSRLLPNQEVAILTFDDQVRMISDFTNNIDTALLETINNITRGGPSTNLYGAALQGMDYWSKILSHKGSEDGNLIIITDGEDTAGLRSITEVINKANNLKKSIFSVAVGANADINSLKRFSKAYSITGFSELTEKLGAVNNEAMAKLETYIDGVYSIFYASPKRSGNHNIIFEINENYDASLPERRVSHTFSAQGFSNVTPELAVYGPKTMSSGDGTRLTAITHFSNDEVVYKWTILSAEASTPIDKKDSLLAGTATKAISNEEFDFSSTSPRYDVLTVNSKGLIDDAKVMIKLESYIKVGETLYPLDSTTFEIESSDGVNASLDNCPTVPNANQSDYDSNGVGDACEPDRDGDGVPDSQDAFPDDPNESRDSDGDGYGDNGDAFPSDPSEWLDSDGDGLGNNLENSLQTNPFSADTDGDGYSDREEVEAGSDPLSANSMPDEAGLNIIILIKAFLDSQPK